MDRKRLASPIGCAESISDQTILATTMETITGKNKEILKKFLPRKSPSSMRAKRKPSMRTLGTYIMEYLMVFHIAVQNTGSLNKAM